MIDTWQSQETYNKGDLVRPTNDNYCIYKCIVAGTSGTEEPTWPTNQLDTVVDGTVRWICLRKFASDSALDNGMNYIMQGNKLVVCETLPTCYAQACDPSEWQASTSYNVGDIVRPIDRNGFVYICTQAGTSGTEEPAWPTNDGETATDGTVTWEARQNFSLCSTDIASGDLTLDHGLNGGRKISVAEKSDILIYKTGVGRCAALLRTDTKELLLVTIPTSAQNFEAGAQAKITTFDFEIEQPSGV